MCFVLLCAGVICLCGLVFGLFCVCFGLVCVGLVGFDVMGLQCCCV